MLAAREMERILVVFRGAIDVDVLRERCTSDVVRNAGDHLLAVCHVLDDGCDGLHHCVQAQRALTAALRIALGVAAENVAVFVASDRDGYRVDDCAREWGATVVVA